MAKVKPSKDDAVCASAASETELKLIDNDVSKKFRFHKVFGPAETNEDVYSYLSYMTESALEGEDCGVVTYGGKGSGKTHTLFGNDSTVGLVDFFIKNLLEQKLERQIRGYVSMSVVSVDDLDVPRDLLHTGGPTVWKIKFSRERYDSAFKNIYKAELLDTSQLTKINIEEANDAKAILASTLSHKTNKAKLQSHIVTIYFDGDDGFVESHGRITFVELISSDWMKKVGSVDKIKSSFHDIMKSFFDKKIVSYQQSYLTYLLRDIICLGVRTAVIGTIDSNPKRMESTTKTISFVADLNLNYDLGVPVRRVLSKQYESDFNALSALLGELEGQNKLLINELTNCLKGPDSEKRAKAKLYAEEVYIKRKTWRDKCVSLDKEISILDEEIKNYQSKYEQSEEDRKIYEKKTRRLEEEIEKKKSSQKGEMNYLPLKRELETVTKEYTDLQSKKSDYEQVLEQLTAKLNEFREKYPTFDENQPVKKLKKVAPKKKKTLVGRK